MNAHTMKFVFASSLPVDPAIVAALRQHSRDVIVDDTADHVSMVDIRDMEREDHLLGGASLNDTIARLTREIKQHGDC